MHPATTSGMASHARWPEAGAAAGADLYGVHPNGARVDAASIDRILRCVTAHAGGTAKGDVGRD